MTPKKLRQLFHIPKAVNGREKAYLASHSLGLCAKQAKIDVEAQLEHWSALGLDAWFVGEAPWYSLIEGLAQPLARIVGSKAEEVVVMNSLTVNLHLMLSSFYRPTAKRHKILTDGPSFPSDRYALASQIQQRALDPTQSLKILNSQKAFSAPSYEEIAECLEREGETIALVFLNGVNYLTGQVLAIEKITQLAHAKGCLVGLDLAHAIGNIPLKLHEWGVDFAVWCHYKYLCGGPGALGGAFVHEKHFAHAKPRLAGWWGSHPEERFAMDAHPKFKAHYGALGWQLSTPAILAATPLVASLKIISEFERGQNFYTLTDRIRAALEPFDGQGFQILTPRSQGACQISLRIDADAEACLRFLAEDGIVCDRRPPNIIRVTPVPYYSSPEDAERFVARFKQFFNHTDAS